MEQTQAPQVEDVLRQLIDSDPKLRSLDRRYLAYIKKEEARIAKVDEQFRLRMDEWREMGKEIGRLKTKQRSFKMSAMSARRRGRKIRRGRIKQLDAARRKRMQTLRQRAAEHVVRKRRVILLRETDLRRREFKRQTQDILQHTAAGGRPRSTT